MYVRVVINWHQIYSDFRALHMKLISVKVLHMLFVFLPDQCEIASSTPAYHWYAWIVLECGSNVKL